MAADKITYDVDANKRWDNVGIALTTEKRDDGFIPGDKLPADTWNYTYNQDFQFSDDTKTVVNSHADDLDARALENQLSLTGFGIADSEFSGLSRTQATELIESRLRAEGGDNVMCYQQITASTFPLLNTALSLGQGQFSVKLHDEDNAYFRHSRADGVTVDGRIAGGSLVNDWYLAGGTIKITGVGLTSAGGSFVDDQLNFASKIQLETTDGVEATRPTLIIPSQSTLTMGEASGRLMVAEWSGDTLTYDSSSTEGVATLYLT